MTKIERVKKFKELMKKFTHYKEILGAPDSGKNMLTIAAYVKKFGAVEPFVVNSNKTVLFFNA